MTHLTQFVFTSEIIAALIGALVGGIIGFGGTYFSYYLNNKGKLIFALDKLKNEGVMPSTGSKKRNPWPMSFNLNIINTSGEYQNIKILSFELRNQQSGSANRVQKVDIEPLSIIISPKSIKSQRFHSIDVEDPPEEIIFHYKNFKRKSKTAICTVQKEDIIGPESLTVNPNEL